MEPHLEAAVERAAGPVGVAGARAEMGDERGEDLVMGAGGVGLEAAGQAMRLALTDSVVG